MRLNAVRSRWWILAWVAYLFLFMPGTALLFQKAYLVGSILTVAGSLLFLGGTVLATVEKSWFMTENAGWAAVAMSIVLLFIGAGFLLTDYWWLGFSFLVLSVMVCTAGTMWAILCHQTRTNGGDHGQ
jgi:hypothetical protein